MKVTLAKPSLPSTGAVHVWKVALTGHASMESSTRLSMEELAKAERFHFERDRSAYVRSHLAVRTILGSYLGRDGASLQYSVGEFGKPALADSKDAGLEFNLSHSGDWALVAIAMSPVGVDVERWDRNVEFLDLAQHFFSERERTSLVSLSDPGLVAQGFFRIWSRKEAYLKAQGCGITNGLHHFDVSAGAEALLFADRSNADAVREWSMSSVDVAPGYSGAVVVRGELHSLKVFDFDG